jgi:DNA/RNA-binding domain of Phe-tRNA-synthetase-like protein
MNIKATQAISAFADSADGFKPFELMCSVIRGISPDPELQTKIEAEKEKFADNISGKLGQIEKNLVIYDRFFKSSGYVSPLLHQYKSVIKKGFRRINPFIDILLLSELSNGILMGVQDSSWIKGDLYLDVAKSNEAFQGMGPMVTCFENEVVLRDDESIIASLYQGPDSKTKITEATNDIIVFAFGIPEIDVTDVKNAVAYYCGFFAGNSNSIDNYQLSLT